jgi:lipopolysaccharide/colanic/teichoic acid biosynthesis glycosyltransferase
LDEENRIRVVLDMMVMACNAVIVKEKQEEDILFKNPRGGLRG